MVNVSVDPRPVYTIDALDRVVGVNRIQVRIGAWEEIEEALLTLRIEATATLPRLKAGACSTCKQSVLKTFPARVA